MEKSKIVAAYIFVISSLVILMLRYGYLQTFNHQILLQQSINNYSSIVATSPVRGTIIDRNRVLLADNKASYVVAGLPKNLKNINQIVKRLGKYIKITPLDKKKYQAQLRNSKNYDWVIIKDDLLDHDVAILTAHTYEFPEISIFARIKRYYPFEDMYAHSIGYVGRLSTVDKQSLIDKNAASDYLANDYIGKNGLEQYYEGIIRGQVGRKIIKTDATGNEIGLISNSAAVDGNTIQLTIDNELQKKAWELLGNHKGAIVALNPQTGGILAFVSKPAFNPNWFIDGINTDDWQDLNNDPQNPLLNRPIQGSYPPGSTFKPFMALAGLYTKMRTPKYTIFDPGYFVIPGSTHRFHDIHRNGLGSVDMADAIRLSSDTYFYKLAYDMGIDRINNSLSLFGFGSKTGIDLQQENAGLLPSREWKARRFAKDAYQKNWQAADSVNIGIGQGFNHYTPLQMAHAVGIIANDGVSMKPHFLDKVLDKNGNIVSVFNESSARLPIESRDIQFVKMAMQKVIMGGGTAAIIGQGLQYTMAGKTGTAQVVALGKNSRKAKFSGTQYKDHSWFIAFAPVDHPQIAAAVIVENGGFGITAAAPILRQLFDFYLLGAQTSESSTKYKIFTSTVESINTNSNSDDDTDDEDGGYVDDATESL